MKQIDFNAYMRNKLNTEVGLSDKKKNLSEETGCMNIIHNNLHLRQTGKDVSNSTLNPLNRQQTERNNNANSSLTSKKGVRDNKIIHLKRFK
jgi:hypothetical protein